LNFKFKSYGEPQVCCLRSHSVICHPTQVNTPRLTHPNGLVPDLHIPDRRKAELT